MAGDIGTVIEKVNHLIKDIRTSNWTHAFQDAFDIIEQVKLSLSSQPITLKIAPHAAGCPDENTCADLLESWCKEAEAHRKKHGAAAAAFPWESLIPLLLQVIQMFLQRKAAELKSA